MKIKRTDEIEKYILSQKKVSMTELYELFNVSENTIRRDLKEILENGNVKKVYGGVIAIERNPSLSFENRKILNKDLKEKIGLKAASYIQDNDVVYIDSGTTTLEILEGIKTKNVKVFTNNLDFINAALAYPNIEIICLAGKLNRKMNSFVGKETLKILELFNIQKAFIAASGVSIKYKITNSSSDESAIKQMAMKKSQEIFLMVDSSKFDKVGLVTFSDFSEIDVVITDKIDKKYREFFKKENIKVDY